MPQYKCVAAPMELVVRKKGDYDMAVHSFSSLINKEITDGWRFHSLENILVTENPGCLAALLGQKAKRVNYNMLIFVKE